MKIKFAFLGLSALWWLACSPAHERQPESEVRHIDIGVQWGVLENDYQGKGQFRSKFVLHNRTDSLLTDTWELYFNFIRTALPDSAASFVIQHVNGDLWKLKPRPGFRLAPNQQTELHFVAEAWAISRTDAPQGAFFVFAHDPQQAWVPKADIEVLAFDSPEKTRRLSTDQWPVESNASLWQRYQAQGLKLLDSTELLPIIPSPMRYRRAVGQFRIGPNTRIHHHPRFADEAQYLADELHRVMGQRPTTDSTSANAQDAIILHFDEKIAPNNYQLHIGTQRIEIKASQPNMAFYALQSLRALWPVSVYAGQTSHIEVPACSVDDQPQFAYRGMHLDVARNFQSKASLLKLIDRMALYKLNKLHLHFCDDEGWRIEIPTLPELTQVGAVRAFSPGANDALLPSFGSGPYRQGHSGSGYYTTSDFIEILRFAKQRHIEIIPELDLPGHARAAIQAMEYRYRSYLAKGQREQAERYRLIDPDDKSEYRSVQGWTDNTTCPVSPGLYRFVHEVTQQLAHLYRQAGTQLQTLHCGGDEVAAGVWEQSPMCRQFLSQNPQYAHPRDLQAYFVQRFDSIAQQYGLRTAGWEEIAIRTQQGQHQPRPELATGRVIPYVWNNKWGWGMEDLSNKLANAGFPTVLCGVTNLYFDLAYTKHPDEPGYYWGGFVDTRTTYEFTPYDVRHCSYTDMMGHPIDGYQLFANKETLRPEAYANILGIQGQLWSENTRTAAMLDYMVYPKLLALAERAWAQTPAWALESNTQKRLDGLNADWNRFANTLGQRELPRLDRYDQGTDYRLPTPAAQWLDGLVVVQSAFPGLAIRYTTDGSEPRPESALYTEALRLNTNQIRLRCFDTRGRGGRSVMVHKPAKQ